MSDRTKTERLGLAPSSSLSSGCATNLPLVEQDAASGEVAALYQQYRTAFGRDEVPGILKCFATSPPILRSMMSLAQDFLFTDSRLTRYHKEMIATFVSNQNGCPYCADSHGYFLRAQGGSPETLSALQKLDVRSPALSVAEQELLSFVDKVNCASQLIRHDDIAGLNAVGWSDAQISETIHVVSLFAAFNRIANAFGLCSQGFLELSL